MANPFPAPASSGRPFGSLKNEVGSFRRSSKITSGTILPPSSPRRSPLCWVSASARTYNHSEVSGQLASVVLNSLAVHGFRPRARAIASPEGKATE
jgi:hypothetical protein